MDPTSTPPLVAPAPRKPWNLVTSVPLNDSPRALRRPPTPHPSHSVCPGYEQPDKSNSGNTDASSECAADTTRAPASEHASTALLPAMAVAQLTSSSTSTLAAPTVRLVKPSKQAQDQEELPLQDLLRRVHPNAASDSQKGETRRSMDEWHQQNKEHSNCALAQEPVDEDDAPHSENIDVDEFGTIPARR